jgi:hypothetical protein
MSQQAMLSALLPITDILGKRAVLETPDTPKTIILAKQSPSSTSVEDDVPHT